MSQLEAGLRRLAAALTDLEIPFFVGGSVASSIYGIPRATMDVDLVADIGEDQADRLAELLGEDFYADTELMKESIRSGRAFNLIHHATSYKFDVFPILPDPYYENELRRRRTIVANIGELQPMSLPVASPEDMILTKLVWYRRGGEVSERQWKDVQSVVDIMAEHLDFTYLHHWARHLDVEDLLTHMLAQG